MSALRTQLDEVISMVCEKSPHCAFSSRIPRSSAMVTIVILIWVGLFTSLPRDVSAAISFTDISSPAGIVSGIRGAHGVFVADVTGDGWDDVYVTNCGETSTPDLLYINQHNSTFIESAYGRGVYDLNMIGCSHGGAFGDIDRDGDYDLVNGNTGERIRLYRNGGTGYFTDITAAAGLLNYGGETRGVLLAYLNDDFRLDIFNVNYGYESLQYNEYYLNSSGVQYTFIGQYLSAGVLNNLYNNDYELEQGITSGDVNGDGYVDLYICRHGVPNQLYINSGDGYFVDQAQVRGVAFTTLGDGVTLGDIDNDGDLDMVLAGAFDAKIKILRNNGSGYFSDITSQSNIPGNSYMAALGDLDLDGDLDMVVTRWYYATDNTVGYYLNNGSGRFTLQGTLYTMTYENYDTRSGALFDQDNDGDLDLFCTLNRGTSKLFRNNTNILRWLKVKLQYRNTAGVFGTRVSLYTAGQLGSSSGLLAMRESSSTFGYLAQNSPVVHFGLDKTGIYDVAIRFPDGVSWNFIDIPSGQVLDLTGMQDNLAAPSGAEPVYVVQTRSVSLSWSQPDTFGLRDYFELYRKEGDLGIWQLLTTTSGTTYLDTSVAETVSYRYRVRSIDSFNRVSDYSNIMSIDVPATPTLSQWAQIILLIAVGLLLLVSRSRLTAEYRRKPVVS